MKYFVWFGAAMVLLMTNVCASATTKAQPHISVAVKPKREAPLSSGSSGYHGPSYKYLPPAAASIGANGYDSYSSHGGGDSSSFGASGYDFGGGAAHVSAPKVETYIVQTEPAHGGYAGSVSGYSGGGGSHFGARHSHFGHGSAGVSGYRYSSGVPHLQSGGVALLGHSSSTGGYKLHAKSRPHIQTIILPASSLTHSSGGSFSSGHAVHSSGGSGSGGYHYTPNFGNSLHSNAGSLGSAHGISFGGGHGSFSGHSNGGFGSAGSHSVSYSPQQGYGYSDHGSQGGSGSAVFGLSSRSHGAQDSHFTSGTSSATLAFGSHGGYNGHRYSQSASSIPSTSYGVPAGPATASYHGDASGTGASFRSSSGFDTPSYAVGHKGLGHFGFSASKPQALNTNFIASANSAHDEHSGRAPFKPSTLLGTIHEVSGPASQYLPPTSPGYEYQSPSVLHGGASTADGASSASLNEPESAYLPPVGTPGASYLPPQHH